MPDIPPAICIVAPGSGYGKTTMLEYLIDKLRDTGRAVCVLKHSAHDAVPDQQKDTFLHRQAGARASALLTKSGFLSLFVPESTLEDALKMMALLKPDLVLLEGFKGSAYPKIILLRDYDEFGILPALENVMAIFYDGDAPDWVRVPVLRRKDEVLRIILDHLSRKERG